jgi:hypothetical protein
MAALASNDHGRIYEAAVRTKQLLTNCRNHPALMEQQWAETRLADFNLWASGIGALNRNKTSLDHRLATKPDAEVVVLSLLQSLEGAVDDCTKHGR